MRGGNARQAQPPITDNGPIASSSTSRDVAGEHAARSSATQPSDQDEQSGFSAGSVPESNSGVYQDVLIDCNTLVERYQKGEKRPSMLRSSLSLPRGSLTTGQDLMRHLDRSSQLLRATIRKLELRQAREKRSTWCSAPPALLYRIQMNHSPMRSLSPKESRSMSQRMHGLPVDQTNKQSYETPLQRRSSSSKHTPLIRRQLSDHSLMNPIVLSSQTLNGKMSSPEGQSISMQYSVGNSLLHRITPKSKSLETLRSPSEQSNQPKLSKTVEIGPLLGTEQSGQPFLHSPTGYTNSLATENTLLTYSQSPTPVSTAKSLLSIKPSGKGWEASGTSSYQTLRSMPISKSRTWIRSGFQLSQDR